MREEIQRVIAQLEEARGRLCREVLFMQSQIGVDHHREINAIRLSLSGLDSALDELEKLT